MKHIILNTINAFIGIMFYPKKIIDKIIQRDLFLESQIILVVFLISIIISSWHLISRIIKSPIILLNIPGLSTIVWLLILISIFHLAIKSIGFSGRFRSLWTGVCLCFSSIKLFHYTLVYILSHPSQFFGLEKNIATILNLPAFFNLWLIVLILFFLSKNYQYSKEHQITSTLGMFLGLIFRSIDVIRIIAEGKMGKQPHKIFFFSVVFIALCFWRSLSVGDTDLYSTLCYIVFFSAFFLFMILFATMIYGKNDTQRYKKAGDFAGVISGFTILSILVLIATKFLPWVKHIEGIPLLFNSVLVFWTLFLCGLYLRICYNVRFLPKIYEPIIEKELNILSIFGTINSYIKGLLFGKDVKISGIVVFLTYGIATFILSYSIAKILHELYQPFLFGITLFILWLLLSLIISFFISIGVYLFYIPTRWFVKDLQLSDLNKIFFWLFSIFVICFWVLFDLLKFLHNPVWLDDLKVIFILICIFIFIVILETKLKLRLSGWVISILVISTIVAIFGLAPLLLLFTLPIEKAILWLMRIPILGGLILCLISMNFRVVKYFEYVLVSLTIVLLGTVFHWFIIPVILQKYYCLFPQEIVGVSNTGGVIVFNKSGELFYGDIKKLTFQRLHLKGKPRIGRVRISPEASYYCLEFNETGDRFREISPLGKELKTVYIQRELPDEILFISDFDFDAKGNLWIVDALGLKVSVFSREFIKHHLGLGPIKYKMVRDISDVSYRPRLISSTGESIFVYHDGGLVREYNLDNNIVGETLFRIGRRDIVDFAKLPDGYLLHEVVESRRKKISKIIFLERDGSFNEIFLPVIESVTPERVIFDTEGRVFVSKDDCVEVFQLNGVKLGEIRPIKFFSDWYNRSPCRYLLSLFFKL